MNLFVDRVFTLFDVKRNNVIDFEEFVTSLSVFHPSAPLEEKAAALLQSIVKMAASIRRNCDIVPVLEKAFSIARSGVPGPVFVECPIDLLYDEALVRSWACTSEKARKQLGFAPSQPLDVRLRDTAQWYEEHGWL